MKKLSIKGDVLVYISTKRKEKKNLLSLFFRNVLQKQSHTTLSPLDKTAIKVKQKNPKYPALNSLRLWQDRSVERESDPLHRPLASPRPRQPAAPAAPAPFTVLRRAGLHTPRGVVAGGARGA